MPKLLLSLHGHSVLSFRPLPGRHTAAYHAGSSVASTILTFRLPCVRVVDFHDDKISHATRSVWETGTPFINTFSSFSSPHHVLSNCFPASRRHDHAKPILRRCLACSKGLRPRRVARELASSLFSTASSSRTSKRSTGIGGKAPWMALASNFGATLFAMPGMGLLHRCQGAWANTPPAWSCTLGQGQRALGYSVIDPLGYRSFRFIVFVSFCSEASMYLSGSRSMT